MELARDDESVDYRINLDCPCPQCVFSEVVCNEVVCRVRVWIADVDSCEYVELLSLEYSAACVLTADMREALELEACLDAMLEYTESQRAYAAYSAGQPRRFERFRPPVSSYTNRRN